MRKVSRYLERAVEDGASDLFIAAGAPVSEKIGLDVEPVGDGKLSVEEARLLVEELYFLADRSTDKFDGTGDDDFSFAVPGLARFRANIYRQRGSDAAVLRAVAFDIPDWRALGVPEAVMSLADLTSGMVVVTGPAGSGKSTTQACIVDRINKTRKRHIVTLEDPIEYLHRNAMSIVSQREVSLDTASYPAALRACLRQAPDVVQLGEMRDPETIGTAMTAAETGHLVLGTLHTKGAANAVDRIVDAFPAGQQAQARAQLAMVLDAVVFQQLVQGKDGLVPAFEVMRATPGIRALIRDGKTHQLDAAIAAGARDGMSTMDKSLANLVRAGLVEASVAAGYATNPEQMLRQAGA